jgi:glycine oxidase
VKNWDVIVIGGGIIGLSISLALKKRGAEVLVVERGEPGREASHAAAGMLADTPIELPVQLRELAAASARMYPEFVRELQEEADAKVDLREQGTIFLFAAHPGKNGHSLPAPLSELEPALAEPPQGATYFRERSVNPRALSAAALKAAKHRGVDIASGTTVTSVVVEGGRVIGIKTDKTRYDAASVVNCAGAWSGQVGPIPLPTRPVKGQMLALVGPRELVQHVIRSQEVYLVPRSDGRILVGSTLEEAGFDKRTDVNTIQRLHQAALKLVPKLSEARILEDWAGLRPGTPDSLPLLGNTSTPGYFVATGHFRDGILLAPVTAQIMTRVITGSDPEYNLSAFAPERFASRR